MVQVFITGFEVNLQADILMCSSSSLPDGYHSQDGKDAGEREDEAREPLQGSLVELSVGRDVGQTGELQSQLQGGESGA